MNNVKIDGFAIDCGKERRVITLKDGIYIIGCLDTLKDHECKRVRTAVAEYSNKYHHILKDDEAWQVREAIADYKHKM
jgi:hypothetical protein